MRRTLAISVLLLSGCSTTRDSLDLAEFPECSIEHIQFLRDEIIRSEKVSRAANALADREETPDNLIKAGEASANLWTAHHNFDEIQSECDELRRSGL